MYEINIPNELVSEAVECTLRDVFGTKPISSAKYKEEINKGNYVEIKLPNELINKIMSHLLLEAIIEEKNN